MNMHVGKTSILSTLDFIEDGRADIYKWGETRLSKRKGIRGKLYQFKKLFIDKSILKSFAHNLTVIVLLQMILAALATFLCQRLELDFDVHVSIFVSPIVFPLAFSINADFQRRERVLEDLAQLKGALVILFFCHRDWLQSSGLGKDFLKTLNQKLKGLVLNIKEYLLTEKVMRRSFILSVIYEDFSDISQLNDKMRTSTLPHNSPLITRLVHYHNLLCHAFERLRVIREYRSPRTIRSFTKVFIFLMPIVLSPYYVHMGIKSGNVWSPYYIAVLSSFMFGTLQGVQDVLDDPFDGISEDDINLGQLEDWTAQSLITNRTITVGRFTVTTSVKGKKEGDMDDTGSDSDGPPSPPRVVHRRKPILRKGSRARVEHGETHPDRARRGMALYPETASRLEDMQRHGLTGSTTILPGMKMKRANSDSLTISGSNASLAMQFLRAQEMANGGREPELKKQVSFCRHVRGLSDDDQEDSDRDDVFDGPASEPTRYPRLSWMIGETDPLIVPDSKASSDVDTETGTSTLSTPELLPRDLPVPQELYEGLRHSPGTSRVVRRPVPAKKNSDAPSSLAKLFMPDRTPDHSDDPVSPPINHAVSLPTSLQTLFAPPPKNLQEFPSHSGVSSRSPSPTRPHVLPISPLALPESPGPSRPKKRSFPAERISRSVPSSPERKHWDNLFRSSAPMMTPPPENVVRIPLTPISTPGISGYPVNLIDQTDAPEPTSGNSRFAVLSPVPTSPVRTTSPQAAHAPLAPEECQVIDTGVVSKPIDMPGSRFRISSSHDADASQGEGQPLVTSPVKNYGVTDPSPDISPSSPPPDVQPCRPSRFSVNPPRKTSQPSEPTGFDESLSRGTPDPGSTRRPSVADHILNIDYDSSEVYI